MTIDHQIETTGPDLYRVPGVSAEQLSDALTLLAAARDRQGDEADARRSQLLRAMLVADFDPVPAATIAQARRLASQREQLLASGAYTTDALQALRGDRQPSATRTWLARRRKADQLFTVAFEGTTLVPAFQLTARGETRPQLAPVLTELRQLDMGGWEMWSWFTSSTPWLDGRKPTEALDESPELVARSARRFTSNR